MVNETVELDLAQWQKLTEKQRHEIINYYWNPYSPEIGKKTKKQIIDFFIEKLKVPARQYGLRSFGWTVYMLYIVVKNSRQRIPSNFLGLLVNKGVILKDRKSNIATVKFRYGGTMEVNLKRKVVIS